MSHQGQAETIQEKIEVILKPVLGIADGVPRRNFRQLVAVYLCTADESTEEECAGFIAGTNGECCFKVVKDGMKTCEWGKSNGR